MIKKISSGEYLKRYGNMEAGEKAVYEKRVGEWLNTSGGWLMKLVDDFDARLQNVVTVSAMWNDAACRAFEEGVRLLSAMTGTGETWLPELLYAKAARRSVMQILKVLGTVGGIANAGTCGAAMMSQHTGQDAAKKTLDSVRTGADAGGVRGGADAGGVQAVPVRPKHIDQYAHLLPKSTQEKAAKVKDLLTELDYAREQTRLLMGAPQASQSDRAAWASKAAKIDTQVGAIYRELDAEWEKLVKSGRVVVDDLGNARVLDIEDVKLKTKDSQVTVSDESAELTSEQKARRRELRKFLTDTRRGNGKTREEHLVKWREAWREYLTLEPTDAALGDEKIQKAVAHYGIVLTEAAVEETSGKPLPKKNGVNSVEQPTLF